MNAGQFSSRMAGVVLAVSIALGTATAAAQTFQFANQGDALSMDPHSLNESFQWRTASCF